MRITNEYGYVIPCYSNSWWHIQHCMNVDCGLEEF